MYETRHGIAADEEKRKKSKVRREIKAKRGCFYSLDFFLVAGFFAAGLTSAFFAAVFAVEDFVVGFFSAGFFAVVFFAGFSGASFSASSWSHGDGVALSGSGSVSCVSQEHEA